MNASARWLALLATAGAMGSAAAEVSSSACHVPPSEVHPLADRDAALSRYEQLPQYCLEAMFMRCSTEAGLQLLDFGSAATCSIGYEALLRRGFAGDFHALMAWWRAQRKGEGLSN